MRKWVRHRTILFLAVVVFGLAVPRSDAHKLRLFAIPEGDAITGSAYMPGGARLVDTRVEVLGPGGERLGECTTAADGTFRFTPVQACDHTFVVDLGDGHRAQWTVAASDFVRGPHGGAGAAALAAPAPELVQTPVPDSQDADAGDLVRVLGPLLSQELAPLRRQIQEQEERTRVRDVLGGVGYIFGIFGTWALVKARRVRATGTPP